ncbi:unnamed protein product [Meloidogyne enterolobii]|uniref:Uncharacterized protein n=1 Tax=Meloidogyne enterolobii TaxID=390850 RepID=A0ACB1A0F1_MELEN
MGSSVDKITKQIVQTNKLIKICKKMQSGATGQLLNDLLVEADRLNNQKIQLFYIHQRLITNNGIKINQLEQEVQLFFVLEIKIFL